jgi:copper chaperone NosL
MSRQASAGPAVVGAAAKKSDVVPGSANRREVRPILVRGASGLAAIGLLLIAARLPIWRAQFSAPQYPNGLDISAYGNRVGGDLGEINELSHYIGMPPFNFVGMPEMRLWPLVIVVAIAAAVLAVVTRRRWLQRLACVAVWLIPIGALADVQFRLWQVGHSLDPTSPIRVTPFTPHVVGPTTLMNFTLHAYPGMALVLIVAAAALVTSAPLVLRRLAP